MAITKIHAIKATVSAAVDYICDEEKTDEKLLISSFATSPQTAADDFRFALSHTDAKDPNLAYHLIQSFEPGELTKEEAHEVGKELADRLLQGKHSYVISTHIDKDHIHNHIIFCAADNFEGKKYHDCKSSYYHIREISDQISRERGLIVYDNPKNRSKSFAEWDSNKRNRSWKSQLKKDINSAIKESKSYEEFLSLMRAKGYEIKDSKISETAHKYIGFRAPGQQRWIRGREKSLGAEYTKERIAERIEQALQTGNKTYKEEPYHPDTIIDTSSEKFTDKPGLKRWADKENLKLAAKLRSEMAGRGFRSIQDIDEKIDSLHKQATIAKRTTAALDKKKKSMLETLTYARQYSEKRKYVKAYKKSTDPDRYYRAHSYDLHLAWGAEDILKSAGLDSEKVSVKNLESEYEKLCKDRDTTYTEYKKVEAECAELTRYRDNLLLYIGEDSEEREKKEQEKAENREKDTDKNPDLDRTRA